MIHIYIRDNRKNHKNLSLTYMFNRRTKILSEKVSYL